MLYILYVPLRVGWYHLALLIIIIGVFFWGGGVAACEQMLALQGIFTEHPGGTWTRNLG